MKSYNNLYEKVFEDDNIRLAIKEAAKNKRKNNRRHRKLRYIKEHCEEYVPVVKEWILNYHAPAHHEVEINDGISAKKRKIIIPTYQEVIIHHAIINVLKPILTKSMYQHSYASIPGRGIHKGVKQVKKWIKNKKTTKYCGKLDIKKFFESIDQEILLNKLRKLIRDNQYFQLIELIIHSIPKGLPLGFTTSQWFANYILTGLDHLIKEEFGAQKYIRFMDDMIIFGSKKRTLHQIKNKIENYLKTFLNLNLKSNWQIFSIDKGRFLDFLGFKFYRNHTGLRRSIALKIRRKAQRIFKKGRANIRDARTMVTYGGFMRYADCHQWFLHYIKPFVNFKQLRFKISNYDKKQVIKCGISHPVQTIRPLQT